MEAPTGAGQAAPELVPPGTIQLSPGLFRELSLHLVKREIDSAHRMTVLGWAWPLARQLIQLGILVLIFGHVLDLGIENFPVFVFSGLIAWNWFAGGTIAATGSVISEKHLLHQPRLPPSVIPMVSIIVPLVDALMALPVLVLLMALEGGVPLTTVLIPVLVLVQLVLMAGVGWITSAAAVFLRDIPNIVAVGLNAMFYLTPVFYGLHSIPDKYTNIIQLNPMADMVNSYRAILLHQPLPSDWAIAYAVIISVVLGVVGFFGFLRLQDRFVDNL